MSLLDKTDFLENGFGIDPEGCGCTDCITGQSFNVGDYRIGLAVAAGRTLYNRSSVPVELPNGITLADDDTWRPGGVQRAGELKHCPHCGGDLD